MALILKNKNGTVEFVGTKVSRQNPCPICSHLHTNQSWCLIDSNAKLAICPRVESPQKIGEAGYLHSFSSKPLPAPYGKNFQVEPKKPNPEMSELQLKFRSKITPAKLEEIAKKWGVSIATIDKMSCGWDGSAWTFPMRSADGKIIGYRRRLPCGKKLCVLGSSLGIIVPAIAQKNLQDTLYITEGESDLSAAIELNMNAIARPGCQSCETIIKYFARGKNIVIIADNDTVGIEGAKKLQASLMRNTKSCIIITPPPTHKDLRSWATNEKATVQNIIRFKVSQLRGF